VDFDDGRIQRVRALDDPHARVVGEFEVVRILRGEI